MSIADFAFSKRLAIGAARHLQARKYNKST